MKRAGHLFAQVVAFDALCAAARRAARGLWRNRSVAAFLLDLEPEVLALQRELVGGTYRPRPPYTFPIADPKPRTISAAAFCDRVVHHALCAALEPALERFATADSYACRRGKGNHAAVRRVQALSRRIQRPEPSAEAPRPGRVEADLPRPDAESQERHANTHRREDRRLALDLQP